MRVLLTTIFAYPPKGGVGVYIDELRKGLEQAGHQVDILARNDEKYYLTSSEGQARVKKRRGSLSGGNIFKMPSFFMDKGIGKHVSFLEKEAAEYIGIVQSLDLKRYDVIHAQDIVSSSVMSFYKPSHVPLILTAHGCVTAEYYYFGRITPNSLGWLMVSSFESLAISQTDRTIVPSEWLKGVYQRCGIPVGKMTVIHNGIDIKSFKHRMKASTGLLKPADKRVIISTGRLEKVKGQHVLLDALAKLNKERKDWELWVAGTGEAEKVLKDQVQRLGLKNEVKFLDRRSDVPALLKQADIFVIPSLEENYPFSLAEAQVAGKAIIASEVGGIKEMIDPGKNGLLVPAGDSNKLYRQLKKLMADPKLQRDLAIGAHAWSVQHLSLTHMMQQVIGIYKGAAGKRN
ncbi:glycosyltransferase family 4 protein [Paenibacillus koleovorans]|uniref:glycosyltransferase family 4 protein n=1 Tax=Paenibacillus koleovorans TaxID=121608 RepID=UPI000FD7BA43|nr:glycosyltransferase family 4 protein [Paenibacillus koleovorans]